MALTIALTYSSETPVDDYFQSVITDGTVFGTGGNPARADVAIYFTGEKIKFDGSVNSDVEIDSYDPETVTDFTFSVLKDGWFKFKYAVIPDYDAGTAYVQYDVVYSGGVVYRALGATTGNAPPNATYWEVISEPTSLIDNNGSASESGNLEFLVYERILYPFAKVCYGDKAEEAALECCSECEREEEVKDYEFIAVMVAAMKSCDTRSLFSRGERIARKAAEFCNQ